MNIVEQNRQERQRIARDIKRMKYFNYALLAISLTVMVFSAIYLVWVNIGG